MSIYIDMTRKEYNHNYYLTHREKIIEKNKKSSKKHRIEWKQRDPEGFRLYHRKKKREWDRKAMSNPLHRLNNNLRGNMYHALKAKKGFRKWEEIGRASCRERG